MSRGKRWAGLILTANLVSLGCLAGLPTVVHAHHARTCGADTGQYPGQIKVQVSDVSTAGATLKWEPVSNVTYYGYSVRYGTPTGWLSWPTTTTQVWAPFTVRLQNPGATRAQYQVYAYNNCGDTHSEPFNAVINFVEPLRLVSVQATQSKPGQVDIVGSTAGQPTWDDLQMGHRLILYARKIGDESVSCQVNLRLGQPNICTLRVDPRVSHEVAVSITCNPSEFSPPTSPCAQARTRTEVAGAPQQLMITAFAKGSSARGVTAKKKK